MNLVEDIKRPESAASAPEPQFPADLAKWEKVAKDAGMAKQ